MALAGLLLGSLLQLLPGQERQGDTQKFYTVGV